VKTKDASMVWGEGCDSTRRTSFTLMRLLLAGLLCAAALTPCLLLAQTGTAKAPRNSNRFLLVVETSRSMQRRSEGVLQAVQGLLKSGLAGQLRPVDSLGVWTYNESLYAGRFPLQTWSPEAQEGITLRTIAFLKEQKYEKQASLDKVLPALNRLVTDSALLTIILISSADEQLHGTPFDAQINGFYQKWQEAQQKARMPFVTVLRAQDGRLADYTVNTPPWPVQMPRLPQQALSAETLQTQVPNTVHTAPPPTAQPLIFSGKKTQPEEAPAPAPEVASAKESLTPKPLVPPATPAQTVKAETGQVVPDKPAVAVLPKPSTTPPPVPEPKMEIAQVPETKPVAPPPTKPEATLAPPPSAPETKPAVRELSSPAPSKVEAASVLPTPAPKPVVSPAASREASSVVTAAPSTAPAPPVQTAAAVPRGTLVSWPIILIVGLVLAGVAVGFVVLFRRRSHAAPGASLITQSFERKNKP
jgi:hypothetical protein